MKSVYGGDATTTFADTWSIQATAKHYVNKKNNGNSLRYRQKIVDNSPVRYEHQTINCNARSITCQQATRLDEMKINGKLTKLGVIWNCEDGTARSGRRTNTMAPRYAQYITENTCAGTSIK
jgi:hypothetical protein